MRNILRTVVVNLHYFFMKSLICYPFSNMQRTSFLILISLALLGAGLPVPAQKFQPKTIQFKGDPEYTDQELLAAAGMKKGSIFTSAEMNDHSKQLMDSGVFDNLTYKFDGVDLIYTLIPSSTLYPVRLENLPIAAGPELDAKLHERFPLYHGKVPSEGTLLDGVRNTLEQMLAAQGINATITATPFGQSGTRNVSAINFSIASPQIRVGALQLQGVSPAMIARVNAIADKQTGTPFDTSNSAANLEHAFSSFYSEDGYAAVKVHAARSGDPVVTANAVDIPYSISIEEGHLYKLGAIHLPPDSLVAPAEIDKMTSSAAGTLKGPAVRNIWATIVGRYHSKGYIDFALSPHPEFDEAAGVVNYTVDINPGPVYHLALLKFDNVSDDLRKLLLRNWQMFPGDPFDESYVAGFIFKAQTSDPVLMRTLAGVKVSYDVRADPTTHDVNLVIRLERR
jgi:outer membrane protein assembly factor BamA